MLSSVALRRAVSMARSSAVRVLSTAVPSPNKDKMALKRFMVDKIRTSGPITVHEYMKTAIGAPQIGYYGRFSDEQKVFGAGGDFITAPELTQLFGEMIGVWAYYELAFAGYNGPWQIVECGPGTGQLMSDVLDGMAKFQEKNMSVHLVETSDALMLRQERLLCGGNSTPPEGEQPWVRKNKSRTGADVFWYRSLDDVPEQFSVYLANEFLDALPIHQFKRDDNGRWTEVYVNIDKANDLVFMNSKGENLHTQGLLSPSIRVDPTRSVWEMSPEAGTYVNHISHRMVSHGGFGLIVDYGHDGSRKDLSLRAYSKHDQVHPLSQPGLVDITADVDFGHLKGLVEDRTLVYGPVTQRDFLLQLGIEVRLRRLVRACPDDAKAENLIKAYNMLMGDEMGLRFKAMAVFPRALEGILEKRGGPAGFAPRQKKEMTVEQKDNRPETNNRVRAACSLRPLLAMLVLVIGDLHVPLREASIPAKFRKLLVPNKMQHVLCTGNLATREMLDYLRSLSSDVHVVRGDFDDETVKFPDTKVITVGSYRIGLCHGHQIVPWGDERMLELLARQLDVDVLVTGHSHKCTTTEKDGRFYINPGSATGAFSAIHDGPVTASFALLDVQAESLVTYIYRLIDDQVKVDRVIFKKKTVPN